MREHSFSITEKKTWVIRESKTNAKGDNKKRPQRTQRKTKIEKREEE